MNTFEELNKKFKNYIQKVSWSYSNGDKDLQDDLIQEGQIAIHLALLNFNGKEEDLNPYFTTYIKGQMMKFLTKHLRTIKIPENKVHKKDQHGERIYKDVDIHSLSIEIKKETNTTLADLIPDEVDDDSDDDSQYLLKQSLATQLIKLSTRQQDVIRMSYFEDKSIKEIAEHFNVTRQAIESTLKKAIKVLKINFISK